MALMPKRVKHRKSQRGRIKGNATRGNKVVFGDFGLQALMLAGSKRRRSKRAVSPVNNMSVAKVGCTSAFSQISQLPALRWKLEWVKARVNLTSGRL